MARINREALRRRVNESGRSARSVSLDAGLGATAIKDILSGKSRDPGAATLTKIAGQLGCQTTDLLESDPNHAGPTRRALKVAPHFLPVRYKVQAGMWYELDAEEPPEQIDHPVTPSPRFAAWPQWLELVCGDSINLKIPPGDYAHVVDAVEMGYAPRDGDWVVVERRRGATRERTIKQVEVCGADVRLWPRSSSPKWSEAIRLTDGARDGEDIEVRVVGLVIGSYSAFT